MAFLQFSKTQMIQAIDTSEKLDLGGFQPATNGELKHVTLGLLKVGLLSSSMTVKLGLHLSTDFTAQFAFSSEIFVTNIEAGNADITTDTWRAIVRFDFARQNINKNQNYRFSLQTTNYTRVGDTSYLAVVRDEPFPIYSLPGATYGSTYPASKAVFSFQEPV